MPIKVQCPNPDCGKTLAVKDELAGKRAKCPGCGGVLQIPNGSAAVAPANPPPARRPAPPPPVEDEGFADVPPPAARRRAAAPPPMEAGYDEGAGEWAGGPRPKSGLVTAIAIINFVLGGLAILCGLLGFLVGGLFAGAGTVASTRPRIEMKVPAGMPKDFKAPDMADFDKEFNKAGRTVAFLGTLIMILSIVNIGWGAAAIPGGIGLLKRRNWGRMTTLVLAGVAAVMGLTNLAPVFMGGSILSSLFGLLLYLAYAGFVFFVLMKPDVRREFA